MAKHGVSLRIDDDKIEALDQLAEALKRDRSFVINEAIESYLEVHKWQIKHIKKSVAQADQENFISELDVKKAFKKWRS